MEGLVKAGALEGGAVAVTGATGFVGRWFVRALVDSGYRPMVVARPETDLSALSDIDGWSVWKDGDELDVWVELGWKGVAGADRNDPGQLRDNLPRVLENIERAARAGARHWIGLGSQAEYGPRDHAVSEDELPEPTTLYGMSKLATGWAARAACAAEGLHFAWLRLFSTYGPEDKPYWFIPYLAGKLLRGETPEVTACEQVWDYLYIEDVATALVSVIQSGAEGFFNLGSGEGVALRTVIETLREVIGPDSPQPKYGAVPYRPDQVMRLEADNRSLRNATGWAPRTGLAEGLQKTVAHLRSSGL